MEAEMNILWFDLETTGTRPIDQVIEFGAVVTDQNLKVLGDYECPYPTDMLPIGEIDPHVLKMHVENNLWEACQKAKFEKGQNPFSHHASSDAIIKWLEPWLVKGRIISAGSGVSHFDRRFLAAYAPQLDKRLTYWNLDVGVMRRLLRLMCLIGDEEYFVAEGQHRALDDAYRALEEARVYGELLSRKDDPRDEG